MTLPKMRDKSGEKRVMIRIMVRRVVQGTSSERRKLAQTKPWLEDVEIYPQLNKQLEIAADELMRELREECKCESRAKASNGVAASSSENRDKC